MSSMPPLMPVLCPLSSGHLWIVLQLLAALLRAPASSFKILSTTKQICDILVSKYRLYTVTFIYKSTDYKISRELGTQVMTLQKPLESPCRIYCQDLTQTYWVRTFAGGAQGYVFVTGRDLTQLVWDLLLEIENCVCMFLMLDLKIYKASLK